VVIVKSSLNRPPSPDWATAARLSIGAGLIALCLFGGLGFGFLYLDSVVPADLPFGVGLVAYTVTFAAAGLGLFAGLAARPWPVAASVAAVLAAVASIVPAVALGIALEAKGVLVWAPAVVLFFSAAWFSVQHFQQMRKVRGAR
jgi:hypothetical protein